MGEPRNRSPSCQVTGDASSMTESAGRRTEPTATDLYRAIGRRGGLWLAVHGSSSSRHHPIRARTSDSGPWRNHRSAGEPPSRRRSRSRRRVSRSASRRRWQASRWQAVAAMCPPAIGTMRRVPQVVLQPGPSAGQFSVAARAPNQLQTGVGGPISSAVQTPPGPTFRRTAPTPDTFPPRSSQRRIADRHQTALQRRSERGDLRRR
jgi:hypothetical protein